MHRHKFKCNFFQWHTESPVTLEQFPNGTALIRKLATINCFKSHLP